MTNDQVLEEHARLERTVAHVDSEIDRLHASRPQTAAYTAAAQAQQRVIDEKLAHFVDTRDQPYFGRVDFRADSADDEPIVGYIGKWLIRDHVQSWTSPFAQVYYNRPDQISCIDTPEGPVCGRVVRKRGYEIAHARLVNLSEEFSLDSASALESTSGVLANRLSNSRSGQLRETIATIQPGQYEQIAASAAQVLLIQGVAGSGKSLVGLHRIAFLLSPFNGRAARPSGARVVFFGPSKTFLQYVGNLLPSLDVRDVTQRTVDGWLQSTLSRKVHIDHRDALFERLLRQSPKQAEATLRAIRTKGSLEMATMLDRYVQNRRKAFVGAAASISVETPVGRSMLDAAQVRTIARALPRMPLNRQRARLLAELVDRLAPPVRGLDRDAQRRIKREFVRTTRPSIERQVQAFWPALDVVHEYRHLLSDSIELEQASRGRLHGQVDALKASLPRAIARFHAEDLAALCYLDRLLDERPSAGFEHVVLDEAQEVSPLELLVIKQHTRGDGFTILGDLAQNLSPNGVEHWQELLKPLKGASTRKFVVRSSFRATVELTRLANAVLKVAHPRTASAIAFKRHGARPAFRKSESYADMVSAIADDIRAELAGGSRTVAITCKTAFEARKLYADLQRAGIPSLGLLDTRDNATEQVVVGPSYMLRGLEFDAVILAGAHHRNYTGTPLHTRLLYLAITRAAHRLHIHWFGTLAKALGTRPPATRSANKRQPRSIRTRQ